MSGLRCLELVATMIFLLSVALAWSSGWYEITDDLSRQQHWSWQYAFGPDDPFVWLATVALAGRVALWRYRRRAVPPGRCRSCGYDLTGNTSGRCPECGTAIGGRVN